MSRDATADHWSLSVPVRGAGLAQRIVGLFLGVAFTFVLFLGIAHYEKGTPARPPPPLDDLKVTLMPVEPPPLPVTPSDPLPDMTPMAGFDLSPTESAVKITVSPPNLSELMPEEMSKAPPADAHIGPLLTDLKPKMAFQYDPQHVYQKSEVDRAPEILERPDPQVSSRVRDNASVLRVTLVVVIDANGSVGHIRLTKTSGNPEFDKLMIESMGEWVFSPAMKNGKKVRCLIEQAIAVQWSAGSQFRI